MSGKEQKTLQIITRLLLLFKMMATATNAGAFDPLDIVILEDMIPSTGSKCNSNFQSIPVDQTTNYTFHFDASQSSWSEKALSMEEALFLAEISHEDGSNQNRSFTLRIGQGGNINTIINIIPVLKTRPLSFLSSFQNFHVITNLGLISCRGN